MPKPFHDSSRGNILRVAGFMSGSGTNIERAIERGRFARDEAKNIYFDGLRCPNGVNAEQL